jgi:hypothetical protein
MTVVDSRTGLLYRLWLTDDGILDDAEWQRLSDAVEARDLWETQQEKSWLNSTQDGRYGDTERRAAWHKRHPGHLDPVTGLDDDKPLDPAGFNGMEGPDVDF